MNGAECSLRFYDEVQEKKEGRLILSDNFWAKFLKNLQNSSLINDGDRRLNLTKVSIMLKWDKLVKMLKWDKLKDYR